MLLLQTSGGVSELLSVGVGFTVIVKVCTGPGQLVPPLVNVGVTVIVAITGAVPALSAVKEGIFPMPFAARFIDGVLFVHEYVVDPPDLFVLKLTAVVVEPLHKIWSEGSLTCADGLTVIVND